MHSFPDSGIIISEVKIRNFRSIREADVKLHRASILIWENNSGKSSFIDALNAAIGQGTRKFSTEDIFLAHGEVTPPKDRHIIVDICLRPYDPKECVIISKFSQDWVFHWGRDLQLDNNDDEFVGIRVDYHWDAPESEYRYERSSLKEWKDYTDFREIDTLNSLPSSQIEPISLYLLDAKRDIQEEFKQRSSFWNKLFSDIKLDETLIQEIEKSIEQLNLKIVDKSDVLQHIQTQLDTLDETINLEKNSISINPLTRHVRDLYKGADVTFSTKGAQSFPISNHGMGTRSLATILTFKAYCEWKEHKSTKSVHTSIALEEPEVHLHPQAQRALITQIKKISAQKIISTHSPYIASETNIEDFIFFRKSGDTTNISYIDENSMPQDDQRKINQRIMKTKGELLFSRVLLFFEGQTESEAFPIFAEKYWGKKCECHGISMVHVESKNYYPFILLAKKASIPWYICADGEDDALKDLSKTLTKLQENPDLKKHSNIVHYPDKKNYEKYIVCPEYREIIKTSIGSKKSSDAELIIELKNNKTKYAKQIAEAIINSHDTKLAIPAKIRELFEIISMEQGIRRCDEV
jgi:putative ATP-dependent endonuclease of the OLD family